MFIATANDVSTIPAPLLDRMELIEVPGYAMHEKVQIAMRHLVPKQMERHGITDEHLQITEEAIQTVLEGYTREAGVRQLDREIATICRGVAVKVAEARDRFKQNDQQERLKATFPAGVDIPVSADSETPSDKAADKSNAQEEEEPTGPLLLLGFERVCFFLALLFSFIRLYFSNISAPGVLFPLYRSS